MVDIVTLEEVDYDLDKLEDVKRLYIATGIPEDIAEIAANGYRLKQIQNKLTPTPKEADGD